MATAATSAIHTSKVMFDDLLENHSAWWEWIQGAIEFESTMKSNIPWMQLDNSQRGMIKSRFETKVPPNRLLLNSFYITLIAGFEEFLRQVIKEWASETNKKRLPHGKVNESLLRTNIRESARLLKRLDTPPDYIRFNESEICRKLGTCSSGSDIVELDDDALSDVDGLLKLENFFKRAEIFGRSITWDALARDQRIKEALGIQKANTRATATALQDEICDMSKFRNRIAHTGGHAADVSDATALTHKKILAALSDVISAYR
ncbi:MAG: hypothetical protein EOP10_18015 [Proteobacteria bacterium]|nr:MAG: hypothetical protein EOP10_18015 [Pseudomonadota bacterium]